MIKNGEIINWHACDLEYKTYCNLKNTVLTIKLEGIIPNEKVLMCDSPHNMGADILHYVEERMNAPTVKRDGLKFDFVWYDEFYRKPDKPAKFDIDKVIFNEPATIVFWKDGSKTVVKCGEDDYFDREKGLAMAIAKRALGDKGNYYNVFKKHYAVDCDDETYVPLSLLKECTTFKKFKELMALVDD